MKMSSDNFITDDMEFDEVYSIGEFLRTGHFGDTWSCTELETHKTYAVKIKAVSEDLHNLREGVIWRRLKHRNIVDLIRVFKTPLKYFLVTELIDGGNLFDQIESFTTYTERDACYFIKQLLEVLAYLREKQVIHRDIKTDNLLIKKSNYGEILKLTDFGLAVRLPRGAKEIKVEPNGVPLHLAPETILEKPVSYSVDIWSSGVILFTLIAGYPPFWNERPEKLYAEIITKGLQMPAAFWENVSKEAKDLIHQLLEKDPESRISAKDALKHEWILKFDQIPRLHRRKTVEKLKEFNARRKLKGAIFTVQTLYRMKSNNKRSNSHGGNSSKESIKVKEIDRKISAPAFRSTSSIDSNTSINGNSYAVTERHKESVISEPNYSELTPDRKISEVNVKFQPVELFINLDDEDGDDAFE